MTLLRLLARIWTVVLGGVALLLWLALAARAVIPLMPFTPAPTVLAVEPADRAADVLPRTAITLRFSTPMNRAAAAALRITPDTPGSLTWSPDAMTLTFQPSTTLIPATTYTVSLDERALGRWWRPLAQPVKVSFRTAPQPAVVAALPAHAGVAPDTSLAVVFSQPMVPSTMTGRLVAMPGLRFDPPFPAKFRWLDQHTLLIRPSTPLAAATSYTATIAADLTDLRGVELGTPFTWRFSTAWPTVLDRTPADGARWVGSRTPLTIRLAAPVDPAQIARALQIEPSVEGELTTTIVDATQVITFTPRAGWQYGTTYTVRLADPLHGEAGIGPWSFTVEPEPRLVAFFPGQGQTLLPGQEIRLVFSTPMQEETLRAGLRIEPPVGEMPIIVSETEVRLRPALRPSTQYTVTLAAGTPDRAGEPLASEASVRLRTAAAPPSLAVPDAFDGIVTLSPTAPAVLGMERINLTALDLRLYTLNEATLLRAVSLRPAERQSFNPERYGQPPVRRWRVPLGDAPDQLTRSTILVGLSDSAALAPGAYFLSVSAPEGPRADLILLVSSVRLTMRVVGDRALVWATGARSGAPLPSLPVSLYRGSALLARGQTNPDGLWTTPLDNGQEGPLIAFAQGDGPTVVRADWAPAFGALSAFRSIVFTDHPEYAPGDTIHITGLARRRDRSGRFVAPAPDTLCRMQLRPLDESVMPILPASCTADPASGMVRGSLAIPSDLEPGVYRLIVQIGDSASSAALRVVRRDSAPSFTPLVFTEPDGLRVRLERNGLPLTGVAVRWRLHLEPLGTPPVPPNYRLDEAWSETLSLTGSDRTDATGAVRIALPTRVSGAVRYRLEIALAASDPVSDGVAAEGVFAAGPPLVAVGLTERVIAANRRATVNLLALDGLGRPVPGARVRVEIAPAGGSAPLLVRQVVTEADGRADVQLAPIGLGRYRVTASAGGAATTTELWVVGGRLTDWGLADGQLALVADRDRYRPGDVARLLVATPEAESTLLLIVERGDVLMTKVQSVRAGQVLALPITDAMVPGVSISAVATTGKSWRWGSTTILVDSPGPPTVTLSADAEIRPPSATSTLTITTSSGMLAAPDTALLTIMPLPEEMDGGGMFDAATWVRRFLAEPLSAPVAATLPQPSISLPLPPSGAAVTVLAYAPPVEWLADRPGSVQMSLPASPGRWLVSVLTANPSEPPAGASVVVSTVRPLTYHVLAPATLHPADQALIALDLRNTGTGLRQVRVRLHVSNLVLDRDTPATQRLTLNEGATGRLVWRVRPQPGATQASFSLSIVADGRYETIARRIPVMTHPAPWLRSSTFLGAGPLEIAPERLVNSDLSVVAIAPSVRAALTDQAERLAAAPLRLIDEQACLALIAAQLARTARGAERGRWETLLRDVLRDLEETQNQDGGWGWRPATPSHPFVTALVMEAQTEAYAALGDHHLPDLRTIAYLSRVAPTVDPDTRAYVSYVLARLGHGDAGALTLLEEPLAADGLAFLSLALPFEHAAPALDRLQALARRVPAAGGQPSLVRWVVNRPAAGLPVGSASVTAAAVQALRTKRPGAVELPGAERALLAAWGVEGWSSAWDAARVAMALPLEATTTIGPRRVLLNGTPLLGEDAPITTTLRVTFASAMPGATLRVEADPEARYLLAYGVPGGPGDGSEQIALDLELVDPTTGAPLDTPSVQLGQIVGLRLTLVTARPILRAGIVVPLPAGLELIPDVDQALLRPVSTFVQGQITLQAADLAPGVYTQTMFARAVAEGTYTAAPARVVSVFAPDAAAVTSRGVNVVVD